MTPVQLQKWTESFHEVVIPSGSWVICALMASKASLSVSLPYKMVDEVVGDGEWRKMMVYGTRIEWKINERNGIKVLS